MRIGIEAQRLFRTNKHGMDFVVLELLRALQKIDTKNEYFVFVNHGEDRCFEESENFKIIEFGGLYPVWEQIRLPRKVSSLKLDILHCTANLAPVFHKAKSVVTVHDIIFLENNPILIKDYSLYQRFGNLYRRMIAPVIMKKADKIITVSESERQLILNATQTDPSSITVVYNALAEHFLRQYDDGQKAKVKEKYGLPDEFLLFLGNTDPKKNTINLFKAYIEYIQSEPNGPDLIIADLGKAQLKKLVDYDIPQEVWDKVHFMGYIDNKDMPLIISLSKVFLYPSKRESFGIPILEGMAQGVPVITSNAFAMPEIAGGAAELVQPEDVNTIISAIKKLVNDDKARDALIEKGQKRVKDFSWTDSARQLIGIYESLS
jgi:glycosyltransferase involved in cell wall biosynthesis